MKNNRTIIIDKNDILTDHFNKNKTNKKILLINKNIYKIEKLQNTIIFPNKDNEEEINILIKLIKKNFTPIKSIIINTTKPKYTKPIAQININDLKTYMDNNLTNTITFIKHISKIFKYLKNLKITIIIHKNKTNIKAHWTITECMNSALITLMESLNEEYKNINNLNINCISTENILSLYKKNIYPYKKIKNEKSITDLINYINFIEKQNIKNKIFKL